MKRILICMIAVACSLQAEMAGEKQEQPRVMVILDERIDNLDATSHKTSSRIETALKANGYRVIDAKQFDLVRQRDSAMRDLNPKKAIALARRLGAEILVTGGATALAGGERETYGFKSYVYVADASVKALSTETGEVLGLFTAAAEKASQAKPTAAFKTLEAVGDSLGAMICASLAKSFEASQERTIEIIVQGVDDAAIQRIEGELPAAAPALRSVSVRFMEGDAATFDCIIRGSAEEVRKQLSGAKNFVVTGFSGSRIDVLYRARSVKRTAARITNGLEITGFTAGNIFPSQALHYVKHPIGTATVKNTGTAEIKNITAKISTAGFMRESSEQTIQSLRPGEEKPIAVFALLDAEKLAALTKETPSQIRIDLTFETGGEEYTRSIVKPLLMLSRHAIAWSRPASVAAFVTPANDAVNSFTRSILADVRHDAVLLPSSSVNMMNAVKVWGGLQAMAFAYAGDAWTAAGKDVLDEVRFPQETLSMRTGDCDDTSVLLASCLESVGVPTAIAVTSDHVIVLFDTGVRAKNAATSSTDADAYVVRGGTVWIPLETTMMNGSFLAAWKQGVKLNLAAAKASKRLDIVDIHQAWQQYPPVDLASDVQPAVVPPAADVNELVGADIRAITQEQTAGIEAEVASLRAKGTEAAANRAAMLLSVARKYDDALGLLKQYVSSVSLNNLGNIYFLTGDSLNAAKSYQAAMKADHNDAGIVLNVGVLKYTGGDEDGALASMTQGLELLDEKDRAFDMLGLGADEIDIDRKAADKKKTIDKAELKRLLESALKDVSAKKAKDPTPLRPRRGENKFIFGGRRGIDPATVIALQDVLYWKVAA